MSSLPEGVTMLRDTLRVDKQEIERRIRVEAGEKEWLARLTVQFAAWEAMTSEQRLTLRLDAYADNFKRLAEMTEDWDGRYGFAESCIFGCDKEGCYCKSDWHVYQNLKKRFSEAETEDMAESGE